MFDKINKVAGKITVFLGLLIFLSPLILKAYQITGNVKDVHEGGNIENAEVIIRDYNYSTRIDTAYTDANGDFSLEWAFNQAPVIYNVSPENGAPGVSTNPELKVIGEDPDNDSLNIEFYKASNDSLIGSDNIQSGDTASVVWESLDNSTLYEWYVKATDGEDVTQSGTWSFTTESGGEITEGMVENLQIHADGNILEVNGNFTGKLKGNIFNIAGIKVGELEKGSFSVSNLRQGNYFMVLKRNGENIAQVKFSDVNNKVLGVSPKWNIEEDNVSSSDSYKSSSSSKNATSSVLRSGSLDSLEFTLKNDSDIWDRVTYRTANLDETNNYDFSVIDKSVFNSIMMAHYNRITQRISSGGTQRWVKTVPFTIDTTANGGYNTQTLNKIIDVLENEGSHLMSKVAKQPVEAEIILTDSHYSSPTAYVWQIHNNGTGNSHTGTQSVPEADSGACSNYTLEFTNMEIANDAYRGEILEELMHGFGFKTDSDIITPSVMNEGFAVEYLTKVDTFAIESLMGRPPKNEDIDTDNSGWYWEGKDTLTTSGLNIGFNNYYINYSLDYEKNTKEKELFFNYGGETIKIKKDIVEKVKLNDLSNL